MRFLVGHPRSPLCRLPPAGLLPLTLLLSLATPSALSAQPPEDTVFQWKRWERALTASLPLGANPYRDVIVRVRFTGPGGAAFTQDAFWQSDDAKKKFKVRAALPVGTTLLEGTWTWQVVSCTGHPNCALVTWTPASGTIKVKRPDPATMIKLYDRGHPAQVKNTTQGVTYSGLLYADYTLFFWAADTAWAAPPREINQETASWATYLQNRKDRQFTAVLIAPAVAWQPEPQDQWPGLRPAKDFSFLQSEGCSNAIPNDCSTPRREYWEAFDEMVQQANAKDLLVGIVGVMDPVNTTKGETGYPNTENAKDFARYLTARLAGNAVIFSPGFDHLASWTTSNGTVLREVMDAVGDAIKEASGGWKLVTAHLRGYSSCADYADFRHEGWMTFYFFQSGHGAGQSGQSPCPGRQSGETATRAAMRRAREMPLHLATYTDISLPSINGEGPYDASPDPHHTNNPYRLRAAGYLSTLSNAAGFTYGATKLIYWYGPPSSFFGIASVGHMQVLYNRFRNRGPFTARHSWILDQTADPDHENKKVLAVSSSSFVMAYVPQDPDQVKIGTASLSGLGCGTTWTKKWFRATSASAANTGILCTSEPGAITLTKPSCSGHPDCDFVLQLEKTGSGLAVPGSTSSSYDLLAWSELDPDSGTSAIYSSRVQPDGTEYEPVLVSPAGTAFQSAPRVARSGDEYWVVWQAEDLDRSLLGVFGRRLKIDGTPAAAIQQLNTYTDDDQRDHAVASDAEGNTFIVWWSYGQDGDLGGVYGRLFDPQGTALGPEFQLHEEGTGFQSMPQVVVNYAGDFVVAWESDQSLDSLGNALVARVFRRNGAALTPEVRVGGDETGVLHLVDVQADVTGGFTMRWTQEGLSEESLTEWRQSFGSNGVALAPPEQLQ